MQSFFRILVLFASICTFFAVFTPDTTHALVKQELENPNFRIEEYNGRDSMLGWECYWIDDIWFEPCLNKEGEIRGIKSIKNGVRIGALGESVNLYQYLDKTLQYADNLTLDFEYRFVTKDDSQKKLNATDDKFAVRIISELTESTNGKVVFSKKTPHQQTKWKTVSIPLNEYIDTEIVVHLSQQNDSKNPTFVSVRNMQLRSETHPVLRGTAVFSNGKPIQNADVFVYTAKGKRIEKQKTDEYGTFSIREIAGSDAPRKIVIKKGGKRYVWRQKMSWGKEPTRIFIANIQIPKKSKKYSGKSGVFYRAFSKIHTTQKILLQGIPDNSDSSGVFFTLNKSKKNMPRKLSFDDRLPLGGNGPVAISDNGKYMAAAYDNPFDNEFRHVLKIWNIKKGEVIREFGISSDEYFSEQNGDVFFGAAVYDVKWKDASCVQTPIYEDDPANTEFTWQKKLKRKATFCLN